ncbi:MAG: hypothetical protein IT513_06800 [Burkholderiales bacterium]|nr:hypothetical protein [Burkholderiales bacterium]
MLELLIASALAAEIASYPAAECPVALQRDARERLVLGLRPACPIGFASTQGAVRALLAHAQGAHELAVDFGRLERHPWLSELLAREASASRHWSLAAGRAVRGTDNAYVAAALRGMPEFTSLFERWQIAGVSVEKVLVRPAAELRLAAGAPVPPQARLPWDAIVWVSLRRR